MGDLVAAPFDEDKNYYRAKVMEVLDDGRVDVYFLDYGDSLFIASPSLFPLQ